jgi:hypothetical protein
VAIALNVDIFDDDGQAVVRHVFFGGTDEEAEEKRQDHSRQDVSLRRADVEDRTREFTEDIDDSEIPSEDDYEEEEADEA